MRYLLDTNAIISLLNNRCGGLALRARSHDPGDLCVSSIVMHELYYGAFKSQRSERNVALVDDLRFEVLDYDREDAREAGAIRAQLATQDQAIGPFDILIAGQAKARGLVLVNHNTGEFNRVSGLSVEDWQG